ncbi:MAG: sigma-70 family RNA polymerase sigma factor [Candidatus Omnitrophica bacterium]|nr:sigma-70 family RNA polymerase sigma factor [Candidatus Omnitrophota bacterium]
MTGGVWSEKSDQDLVLAFKEGEEAAFGELVRRYKEKAMQLAWITTGNYEDAKDAAQEAFIKVHQHLHRFEMKSQFMTWFYRILMNTAKDFIRKRKWKRFLLWKNTEEMNNYFDRVSDPSKSPSKDLLNTELGIKMTESIKKLPFQQQWIFTLRYLKGFSIEQIADVTELSEGTVKATIHFAAEKFKKEIFPYLQEGGKLK